MGASDISVLPPRDLFVPTTIFMAGSATSVGLIVGGAAGQISDLVQFQDSVGNTLTKIDSRGTIRENRPAYYRMFLNGGN